MSILKNFDLDTIRRERARKAAGSGVDLVAGLNAISADIAKLGVGDTAKLEIPNYKNTNKDGHPTELRSFVMSITAKLNNLTPRGGDWEGRTFKVISDGERYVYVQRGNDLKGKDIPERKRSGRRAGTTAEQASEAVASGETVSEKAGTLVTEHA